MLPRAHPTSEEPSAPAGGLLHRLPWNALFWWFTLLLVGASVFFAVSVQIRRGTQIVEDIAVIANGEAVDVVLVLNGDEIMVRKDGKRARVRMLGIHSFDPVINEREITGFGQASVSFLDRWILNNTVRLRFGPTERDVRGRYLAYVERDGIDINHKMVEDGIAMVYTEYAVPREQAYLTTESHARQGSLGIWGGPKANSRIVGLRREWAISRLEMSGRPPPDYLLEDAK